MDDSYSFGAWVGRRRRALRLTQADLARLVGVAAITIQKIEADERRPSRQVAELLADQLQVSLNERKAFLAAARGEQVVDQLPPPIPGASVVGFPSAPRPPDFPSGTVTFLFTDIEGSTQRWEQHPATMRQALVRHDAILRAAIESHGGHVFKTIGDSFCTAFASAPDALAAALAGQRALVTDDWGTIAPLQVRMALHTGTAEPQAGDYVGQPLNRIARLLATAHGGQILLSLATHELIRDHLPDNVHLRDLGVHRLRDVVRPEPLFQVDAPDLPADFPPLNSLDAPITNLPAQVNTLIGRRREIADVIDLRARARLVTLTGPGGTGKTRLALQIGSTLLDQYANGVWFVDLSPISDPEQIASAIAQVLGIPELPDRPIRASILSWLRERQVLLIIDNCEQVIAGVADLLAELLRSVATLTVLATSRIPLRITAEQEYAVTPLALPLPGTLPSLDQLSQYDAVALFIARARAVRADFAITNTNAPAVAEICTRLDGLPLAIELAAARIRLFPPEQLLSRLVSARMQTLTGGARDLPARQQTMWATIDWSYRLLTASQQTLMARLGVFVGGWTLEAAEAVCTDEQMVVLPELDVLVEHSLVHVIDQTGAIRYTMLETIREYALERLMEHGELNTIQRYHAAYMIANAEAAEPRLVGDAVQQALSQIAADIPNMRAAIQWACTTGEWNTAARISAALTEMFLLEQTYIMEGASWLRMCLEYGTELRENVRAKVGVCFGRIQGRVQHDPWIDDVLQESFTIAQRNDDARGMARAIIVRSEQAWRKGNLVDARADAEDGLARAIVANDQIGQIWGFFSLGWILGSAGEYVEAQHTFELGLTACRRSGYAHAMADMLLGLAEVAFLQDAIGEAETHTRARLLVEQQIGNPLGVGSCYEAQGVLAFRRRDYAEAIRQFEEGLYLYDMWMPPYSIQMRSWLSMAAALVGDLDRAMVYARNAGDRVRLALSPTAPMASAARDSAGLTAAVAALALNSGHLEITIRLCSAMERTYTEPLSLMIASPADRPFREHVSNLARERLGNDVCFERLRADSSKMTLDQAADEALAWLETQEIAP